MKVVLVEDDYRHADRLTRAFKREFREVEVRRINTESQFQNEIHEIETFAPDLIILDIMLRWADPTSDMSTVPEEVKRMGHFSAGFRCLIRISNSQVLYDTPIILNSVLEPAEIKALLSDQPAHVFISQKTSDLDSLFRFVRAVMKELPEDSLKSPNVFSRLFRSAELKPGWLGLRVDLKSLFGRKEEP